MRCYNFGVFYVHPLPFSFFDVYTTTALKSIWWVNGSHIVACCQESLLEEIPTFWNPFLGACQLLRGIRSSPYHTGP